MKRSELYKQWCDLLLPFNPAPEIGKKLFNEIVGYYTEPQRHYHTLQHLHSLLQLSNEYHGALAYPDVVQFAIFYHDAIYTISRSDNEERSAVLAEDRLLSVNVSEEKVKLISHFIRCTQTHEPQGSEAKHDLEHFLDFDLSILGAHAEEYEKYAESIRKEYKTYPGFLYRRGRKKVLTYFLKKKSIFLTDDLHTRFEKQARINLKNEMDQL